MGDYDIWIIIAMVAVAILGLSFYKERRKMKELDDFSNEKERERKLKIQDNEPKDKILQSREKFEEKYGIREIKDNKTEKFDENSQENTVSSESSDTGKNEEVSNETENQNNDDKFLFKRNTESEYSKKKKRVTWWTIIFVVLSILKFCNSQNEKEIMDRYSQQQEKYEKNQENDELKIEILRDNNDCFALNLEVTEGYYIWLKQIFKDKSKKECEILMEYM